LDRSPRVIEAARVRLASLPNVHLKVGDMHQLPFADRSYDQVLQLNSLTYARSPEQALAQSARVLRPGGTLVVVTLNRHRHLELTAGYGHLHPGFTPTRLRALLRAAGLSVSRCGVTSRERRKPYFEVVTAFAEPQRT
jgi:ubiquinone/menaquinone biosynthesis C-methylase UbiE